MTAAMREEPARRRRPAPDNTKPWTAAELEFARKLYNAGHDPAAIALAMPHRTPRAIENQLRYSGMWRVTLPADRWLLDLRGRLRGRGSLTV